MTDYTPKPGDKVRCTIEAQVLSADSICLFLRSKHGQHVVWLDGSVTVERAPEPDWQPGDVARDGRGRLLVRVHPYGDGPWVWLRDGEPGNGVQDRIVPRPLTPLVLNGNPVSS